MENHKEFFTGRNQSGMKKTNWKRWVLVVVLLGLLLGLTGCFVKPDNVVDESPTDPIEVLPFPTITPTPVPDPNQQGGDTQDGTGDAQGGIPDSPTAYVPAPTATIALITASPTAFPAWTYSPAPTTRPTATDNGTLRNGSTGDAVRKMQQRLKELGYYTGSVDGDFGAGTESALKDFQRANGLTADGIAGQRTLTSLNSSSAKAKASATPTKAPYATSRPTPKTYTPSTPYLYKYLQLGSSGSDVRRLQQKLKDLGYFNGTVNGSFGEDTQAAVEAFQKRNGCYVDGVAGEDTQRILYSNDALPFASTGQGFLSAVATQNTFRTLRSGMAGDDVLLLQDRLRELYYFSDTINGVYGTTTQSAVKVFQQRNGLTADGVAGSETLSRVFASSALYAPTAQPTAPPYQATGTLQAGSIGEDVYNLQERLFDLGYYTGQIDGIYSNAVTAAVRAFQGANKLTADGKAGATTQRALFNPSAVAAKNTDDTLATLKEGDQGERVLALQTLLNTYGYYTDDINGRYGTSTTLAVQLFQSANGLTSDGIAGPATNQLLYQGTPKYAQPVAATGQTQPTALAFETLRQGMSGPNVMVMQEFLQQNGYFFEEPNGEFGATTLVALQAFQSRNSLKADGIAGPETLALLFSGNSLAADGSLQAAMEESDPVIVMATPVRTSMKEKDEGQDVFDLQSRLKELGYFSGSPSGNYDTATSAAVRAFQGKNSLTVDGAAGPATLAALYAANVVPNIGLITDESLPMVSNNARELEEQNASGAIQASLAGGGVAASYSGSVYYAGEGGAIYATSGSGSPRKIYDSPARFIHASSKGITFVSGSKVMRISVSGGNPQTLIEAGSIQKFSLLGDTMYYLEGSSLIKANNKDNTTVLAGGVKDFCLDVYQSAVYVASDTGLKRVSAISGEERVLVSTGVDQVQICDSVVFFRSGGSIYRIHDGVSILLVDAEATWMGIYRDMIYYISGDRLYRCETAGQNSQVFYDGQTADVSFVAGKVYITKNPGGPVVEVLAIAE